ncbi:MAG: DUF7411 family protein [Candidatus Thorarchaeota archaeon]|nr:MAG: hypothetical protein DRO87_10830 [Candidatus Thorarchaeota archaeon]RLI56314.1 MAG: hypothetical protein DRP09_06780 [Candidatus Thorarchaeota archaeon]
MTGLVGLLRLTEEDNAEALHNEMVQRLSHRGPAETYHFRKAGAQVIISVLGKRRKECVLQGFEGYDFLGFDIVDQTFTDDRKSDLIDSLSNRASRGVFGAAAVGVERSGVRIYRSSDGMRPLYYAPLEDGYVFSTERKSIWGLKTGFVRPLELGELIIVMWNGVTQSAHVSPRRRPPVLRDVPRKAWIDRLGALLRDSFEKLRPMRKCAVLFSGGVDSSLAALLASEICNSVLLVSCASEKSKDIELSRKAARLLGLDHIIATMTPDDAWAVLPEVIYSGETTNRMDVEIALPFFLAAREAKKNRYRLMVSGQGPDELFAGYAKHETVLENEGPARLKDELWSEVSVTHEANIARDERVIAFNKMEAFFPYLHGPFVEAALQVPTNLLISLNPTPKRKIIFRALAKKLGLPSRLASAKKHATQYSSGSARVLQEAIRNNVDEAKGLSRKMITPLVQDVLDYIGEKIDVPPQFGFVKDMSLKLRPLRKLQRRIGS